MRRAAELFMAAISQSIMASYTVELTVSIRRRPLGIRRTGSNPLRLVDTPAWVEAALTTPSIGVRILASTSCRMLRGFTSSEAWRQTIIGRLSIWAHFHYRLYSTRG